MLFKIPCLCIRPHHPFSYHIFLLFHVQFFTLVQFLLIIRRRLFCIFKSMDICFDFNLRRNAIWGCSRTKIHLRVLHLLLLNNMICDEGPQRFHIISVISISRDRWWWQYTFPRLGVIFILWFVGIWGRICIFLFWVIQYFCHTVCILYCLVPFQRFLKRIQRRLVKICDRWWLNILITVCNLLTVFIILTITIWIINRALLFIYNTIS